MANVKLEGVWKIYNDTVEAVKGIDLDIKDGEFVSLLGPSGCGKSSTLRMIAGLEDISKGKLYIGDTVMNDVSTEDRQISMVFENYALLPHMTVYDNIAFPLTLKNIDKDLIEQKVKKVSELLDMDEFLYETARSLGGGQKQRTGLARALVTDSSLVLYDEPISHLDADLRAKIRTELARIQNEMGVTSIYVTHDQIEALSMADRIAVMNMGEIQQYADPDVLYNQPANKFVAGFIGTPPMNFIECVLVKKGKTFDIVAEEFKIELDEEQSRNIIAESKETKVWFGVRPQHVSLCKKEKDNCISIKVNQFARGCEQSTFEVLIGGEIFIGHCAPDIVLEEGEAINIDVISTQFHLFDYENENTLIKM